jgi:hypothetical protein
MFKNLRTAVSKTFLLALPCFALLLLSACELPRAITARDLEALRNSNDVAIVRYAGTQVSLDTALDKLAVGLIASGNPAHVINSGDSPDVIFEKLQLPQPSTFIEATLRKNLSETGRLGNLSADTHVLAGNNESAPVGNVSGSEYAIVIGTPEFFISEHAIRRPRFEVMLIGRAKLIRLSDGKALWSEDCTYFERDDKRLLFNDDPFANNGAILREVIPVAAEGCARKLTTSLVGG